MTTTTLNVSLSDTLHTKLSGETTVQAWAIAYGEGIATPTFVSILDATEAAPEAISLPNDLVGGKVYFLIQSADDSGMGGANYIPDVITEQSQLNWFNGQKYGFRLDSFEVTLSNNPADAGNLTSVNGFGLPMGLTVKYSDGENSRGYSLSGSDLFTQFDGIGDAGSQTVYTYAEGALAGENMSALSPAETLAIYQDPDAPASPQPFNASDWEAYVESLLDVAPNEIILDGFFNGAADANGVYHQAGYFAYTLEGVASDDGDYFWLSPTSSSQIKGYIKITSEDLQNSIYSTLGNVGVYTSKTDATPYQILDHDVHSDWTMNSGENNQWGAVLTQLVTGFSAGYFGNSGASLNPSVTEGIDLNKTYNWDPTYAFGEHLKTAAAHSGDPYAEILFKNSNSYGFGYSDNVMQHFDNGDPLISVSNSAQSGGTWNVSEIDLTIFDDSETPTGYVQPEVNNYLTPIGGTGYEKADTTGANNITLNFFNTSMMLANEPGETSPYVALKVKSTKDFDAPDTLIEFKTTGDNFWGNWTIVKGADGFVANAPAAAGPVPGSMTITGLPYSNAGDYWYQIVVGKGDVQKTFNLYARMDDRGSGLQFENPKTDAMNVQIDGLAQIAAADLSGETVPTFSVNLLHGTTSAIDPSLLTYNPDNTFQTSPSAPVAGRLGDGAVFEALDGQTQLNTNTVTTSFGSVVFGWTGLNVDATDYSTWLKEETNKIQGLNYAVVEVKWNGSTIHRFTNTQADIDGQWETPVLDLSDGTYTVTMTEYIKDASTGDLEKAGKASGTLTVDVQLQEGMLEFVEGGSCLGLSGLVGGSDPENLGSWISFDVQQAAGTRDGDTILLFVRDLEGYYVSREGFDGPEITFEQSIRGALSSVHADDLSLILLGNQTVYLEADQVLCFAVLSGNGRIDMTPTVQDLSSDGNTILQVGDIQIQAVVDNDLTFEQKLASAQRSYNEEFVFLEHGTEVSLNLAGSAGNINQIGFVRVLLDPETGDPSSVGGVEYGNTEEFRQALRDEVDGGYLLEGGGGTFDFSDTWVVDGEDGYYAPVLFTQSGNVFFIGDAHEGGYEYIRTYGANTFGFEDLSAAEDSDFDYNDMVLKLSFPDDMV
ncbi:hypothetical protein [Roseibium sp. Sym1]|uniref:hypothetical protein n=1 Tax=Roseibium sp. Sym1 TaxID=3016006 RepID=UPI0022B4B3E7|nr:hypothetical protein [Roseibium sp. Sym1]